MATKYFITRDDCGRVLKGFSDVDGKPIWDDYEATLFNDANVARIAMANAGKNDPSPMTLQEELETSK